MRAAIRKNGIEFSAEQPLPPPPKAGSEEVVVKVRAAAINPIDYKGGQSMLGPVAGLDFAGTVSSVADGSPTHGLKIGDAVYGTAKGTLADFVKIPDGTKIGLKPKCLNFNQAAAFPTSYLTALQALRDHGSLAQGGRALVIGASGGSGYPGILLGRYLGASHVVGVCSGRNRELVERLGAHRVVDYSKERISDIFGSNPEETKFDVVYDAASGSGAGEGYQEEAWKVLKKNTGQYVPINGGAWMWTRFAVGMQAKNTHLFLTKLNRTDLDFLSNFAEVTQHKPIVAATLPLTAQGIQEGFDMLKGRRTVGKIVFDIDQGTSS